MTMIGRYAYGLTSILIALCLSVSVRAGDKNQILDQKKELEKIRKDVETGQRRLDSLKGLQMSIQQQIADADQKISSDKKVIGRLNNQLKQLKNDIADADQELVDRKDRLEWSQRRYLGNIRQFYFAVQQRSTPLARNPNIELERNRQVVYLSALANFESGNVEKASLYLAQAVETRDELSGQSKQVSSLKKKKEVAYTLGKSQKNQHEKQLDRLRRKTNEEAERIMTLQMAAEEMQRIIARLEEERQRAARSKPAESSPSVFATLKGQLLSPFRGKIVVPFGQQVDPITNLKSYSPGISIKGRPKGEVSLVASGTVAYTGNLRGYGNFVIINHDNQYYTTYAGLGQIFVQQGQHLATGSRLALASDDGIVKFELRNGRDPLDPVTWIRFESL